MNKVKVEVEVHPLKHILRKRGLSQVWLAKKLGISVPSLSAYLNGYRQPPPEVQEELEGIKEALEMRK
jgi:predicted transcriptional regulator